MSDQHDLLDLPILDELGAEMARAFRAAEADGTRGVRPTGARRRAVRRVGPPVAALITALAVGAAVVVAPWSGSGGLGPSEATAAGVLTRAAAVARAEGATRLPRAEQFAYTDELTVHGVYDAVASGASARRSAFFQLKRTRRWQSAARRGVATQRTLDETRPGALPPTLTVDPGELRADGRPPTATQTVPGDRLADGSIRTPLGRTKTSLGGEELSPAELRDYPTQPAAIVRRLRRATAGQGRSPNGELWVAINDALRGAPLPGPLTAGLYRALATLPGVTLDAPGTDRLGRRVTRLSYQEPGTWERQVLLLDARTYRRLGEQTVVASAPGPVPPGVPPKRTTVDRTTTVLQGDDPRPGFPPGTVLYETLVLRSGVADRVGGPLVRR
ncbi:CU044_5270 family protein [Patulibacter americanus]|uniref:CU044_5270 family protein n=1 Tax=Patulibacter americanus TaxID=588672 RepID=UPI0003B39D0A|nr:CU044_5270 family protein [Patulibacter americanus]